jgi:predicted helicase
MIKGEVPNHFFVSDGPVEKIFLSPKTSNNAFVFPLYLYPVGEKERPDRSGGKEGGVQSVMQTQTKREPNLSPDFIKAVSDKLGMKFIEDGRGDLVNTFGPEDIFNYAYAVFHSPTYRSRYAEFLKIDFPRLPLTSDKELFKGLADKGAELVTLHLMEAPMLEQQRTQIKFDISGSNVVDKVTYNETGGRVYISKQQYFEGVPPEVWGFHIGGYQVCQKWLKDRKDRTLTYDERVHYQKIIISIKETIRLMAEIDKLIPGWPVE